MKVLLVALMLVGCSTEGVVRKDNVLILGQSNIGNYSQCANGDINCSIVPMLEKELHAVFTNKSVGGSEIAYWSTQKIDTTGYDYILFHQGESDSIYGTSRMEYKRLFLMMGLDIPIYLARASYSLGVTSVDVITAQNELIEEGDNIYIGPNTDMLGAEYRYDNIHFNYEGLKKHAEMWIKILKDKK